MQSANGEYIIDINTIEALLNEEGEKIKNCEKNILASGIELNDYNEPNLSDLKNIVKSTKTQMRKYKEILKQFHIVNIFKDKIIEWCFKILNILDSVNQFATSTNAKVLYYRLKADYYRYLAELYEEDKAKYQEYIQNSLVTYNTGMELSLKLPIENPNRLGITLNYTVLLSDEIRDVDQAIEISKNTLALAKVFLDDPNNKNNENYSYAQTISDLMAENLSYYQINRLTYIDEKNNK